MIKEFKEFILRGNVIDLAIAFILGAAFTLVVKSFANDVLMNLVAALFGKPDFNSLTFAVGKGVIKYGAFLTTLVNFLIVAFVLFLVVKTINRFMKKPQPAPPNTRPCPYCKTAIPKDASRCSACTSQVEPEAEAAPGPIA